MTACRLYDTAGRNIKPMLDDSGEQLVFEFDGESPQNGDLIVIDDSEYMVQRAWINGELVVRLRQVGP